MSGLLCIIAHPDDEIFCAGLISALTSKNIPVHIVCMTRGEGGQLGDPPKASRENLGRTREREMACSAEALNVSGLEFLDYIDPITDDGLRPPDHDPAELTAEIVDAIARCQPDVVLTHGSNGDYGHPAHILVHERVKAAVISLGSTAPVLYSFNAAHLQLRRRKIMNADDWADWVVDVSPFNVQKISALKCHATQWETLVGKREDRAAYRTAIAEYIRRSSKEAYHRHWPRAERRQPDALQKWSGMTSARNPIQRCAYRLNADARKTVFLFLLSLRRVGKRLRTGVKGRCAYL